MLPLCIRSNESIFTESFLNFSIVSIVALPFLNAASKISTSVTRTILFISIFSRISFRCSSVREPPQDDRNETRINCVTVVFIGFTLPTQTQNGKNIEGRRLFFNFLKIGPQAANFLKVLTSRLDRVVNYYLC